MVDSNLQTQIDNTRSEELWLRYDSLNVGKDATKRSTYWFETFSGMGAADLLVFNDGSRTKNCGKAYCNASGNTEDWGQKIYQTGVEFYAPIGDGRAAQYGIDANYMPLYWLRELPNLMHFTLKLQDTDEVLLVPGLHLPSGTGATNGFAVDTGLPVLWGGNTGNAGFTGGWVWPEPLIVPAKKKLVVEVGIDSPGREFLQQLDANPGVSTYTVPDGANPGAFKEIQKKLWFGIRVWHRGPRFVQLRGAYSA